MKKNGVLNHQLSQIIAAMGHTDMLVIADSGLPVPPGVECVDLAVCAGLPGFLDVVAAVATELEVEQLTMASELQARGSTLPEAVQGQFPKARFESVPHDQFKALTTLARAVVRTGEQTPYANVILHSGVTF